MTGTAMTFDEILTEHLHWLIVNLPVIYGAIAGALLRLLMIRNEPFWVRTQNALGGMILAMVLAPMTAEHLSGGKFAVGYALAYGLVARELILPAIAVINKRLVPLLTHFTDTFLLNNLPSPSAEKTDKEVTDDPN